MTQFAAYRFGASPEAIWKRIVDLTERVQTDEARSLRVLFYVILVLHADANPTLVRRIRARLRFLRQLTFPSPRTLPKRDKGKPLFAFLYDTPANTNNLLPVLKTSI